MIFFDISAKNPNKNDVIEHKSPIELVENIKLNNAEINDLNNVLQQVGNVTKIVTLVDNVDQGQKSINSSFVSPVASNAQPEVQTPVAIDPDQVEPTNVQ